MKQVHIRPYILFMLSSMFFLGYGLTACNPTNKEIASSPTRTSQDTHLVLPATSTAFRATLLPFTPGATFTTTIPITPTLAWPYNLPMLDGDPSFSLFFTLLSPNGQWLINARSVANYPSIMEIISTSDPTITLSSHPVVEYGMSPGSHVISWSPDSRAIVVESASEPAPCGYDRITIYQITDQFDVTHAIYYLPDGENGCFSVAWSPDSSQLALFDGADSVTILDRQGQFIQNLAIPVRWKMFWTEHGLIAEVRQEYGHPVHTELRLYDLASQGQFQTLLERDEYFLVMGYDEQFHRVLVASLTEPPNIEVRTYQLQVYDLTTGESQPIAALQGGIWYDKTAYSSSNQIAFIFDPRNGESKRLMVFDWATMDMTDHGEIAFLIGWRPNVDGILIVNSDDNNNYWIEVVPIEP
jgi:hypothetical protein